MNAYAKSLLLWFFYNSRWYYGGDSRAPHLQTDSGWLNLLVNLLDEAGY